VALKLVYRHLSKSLMPKMTEQSYVNKAKLNHTDDILEARIYAGLSVDDCIELCDVSRRTWYRWRSESAPKWAVRLILSQAGTLDHLGWTDWQIRGGRLYCNQLSYRYWWEPQHLVMPLYGVTDPDTLKPQTDDDSLSNVVVIHKQSLAG